VGIANDYTPIVDDLTAPTIAHAAFRIADEVRLLKARAKYLFDHQQDSIRLSYRVKASEFLDKNVPVRVVGYDAILGMVIVAKANTSTLAFGVTREVISQGSSGLVTYSGILDNIDTSAWPIGTILYVGDKGTYTTIAQTAGYAQPIAYVIEQDQAKGSILVVMGYLNQEAAAIRVTPLSCITGYTVQEVIAGIGTRLINAESGISVLKARLGLADDSINLPGTPTAATAPVGTNNTQLATTAFVTESKKVHYMNGATRSYNTVYQASKNICVNVLLKGSYVNGAALLVGIDTSTSIVIAQTGDDISNNTKSASFWALIPAGMYWKVAQKDYGYDFENISIIEYPFGE
jgi:hypothetical protein